MSGYNELVYLTTTAQISGVSNVGEGALLFAVSLSSLVLDKSIEDVDDMAFLYCTSLTNINLENIKNIGNMAIGGTIFGLKEIKLGDKLNTIGGAAFGYNCNLTKIEIPSSVTTVGEDIFVDCENLTDIYVVGKTEDNLPETWSANWLEGAPENVTVHWNESMPK